MASDKTEFELDIDLTELTNTTNEVKPYPHNMGNVSTLSPPPTLVRKPAGVEKPVKITEQSSLLDLCSSISASVEHLGLDQVKANTIEYVDNDNKSVLLVNKHLMNMGSTPIPVIAPGLAIHYLKRIKLDEVCQGSILLYTLDGENASLGILMSTNMVGEDTLYKTLTTIGDEIRVIHLTADEIKIPLRQHNG